MPPREPAPGGAPAATPVGGPYARYVLGVLVLVYVANFLDRQILSILAEEIKRDLGLSDDQIGFLYGTAFAVFYAIFGIPLGRLADLWDRRRLIAIGLCAWSAFTALSGLARSFGQLAAARVGVGIGEASASPAAFSMLSDYFPAAQRATVLAIYSSGIYLGVGLGLGIGGLVVDQWNTAFAETPPPLGLRGWQVAFFVVGLPGLALAAWVATLREPVRGQADGIAAAPPEAAPFRQFFRELGAVLPPLTVVHLARAGGPATVARNLAAAALVAAGAGALVAATGSVAQWTALGIGVYAAVSWGQALRLRDPLAFDLIFRTRSLRSGVLAFSFLAFLGYGIGFWTPPFLIRKHGISEAEAGLVLGGTAAAAGWLGVTFGGWLADRWQRTSVRGRLRVAMLTAVAPLPFAWVVFVTDDRVLAYVCNFPLAALSSMWIGPGASMVQEHVLPRMRATASAAYLLAITFVGLALGPWAIGFLSARLGSLELALLLSLGVAVLPLALAASAGRTVEADLAAVGAHARRPV